MHVPGWGTAVNVAAPGDVLEFAVSVVSERDYAPTVREIGGAVGMRSTSVIAAILDQLHDEGLIRRAPGAARGIDAVGQSVRRGGER